MCSFVEKYMIQVRIILKIFRDKNHGKEGEYLIPMCQRHPFTILGFVPDLVPFQYNAKILDKN
jgi:hypothetical protein